MELPALITLIALVEYMFFAFRTGFGRDKYGVDAPATTGNEVWERYYRVQQNTLEQLIIFIPALWTFAYFVSPLYGALIGLLFVIGRPLYYVRYIADPTTRAVGFILGFFANVALVLGSIGGVIYSML